MELNVKGCINNTQYNQPVKNIISKQSLLKESLKKFYNIPGRIEILLSIVYQKTNLSLRLLDWLVTNYAKSKNIIYEIEKIGSKTGETCAFNVFLNYKTQLKAYSKKQFDPFCRRERIEFEIDNSKNPDLPSFIKTTIGQLNFFRWAIQNKIIDYAINNIKSIETNMINSIKHRKGYSNTDIVKKKRGRKSKLNKETEEIEIDTKKQPQVTTESKKKRKELSISATKTFTKYTTKIVIEFG